MSGRALITGATGFVGRLLGAHLQTAGWEIIRWGYPPEPDAIACDLTQADQVENALKQSGPLTHVFHLAALTFVPDAIRDPGAAMRVNYQGTVTLAESIRKQLPEARFLYVSSAEVYGPPKESPLTEEHPLFPANPYAISKAAADLYGAFLYKSRALDVLRLRPFNHSGPGQSNQFVLSSFARQIADIESGRREPVLRVGNLASARDFLHVNDVLRAYEMAARLGQSGEAYNVCSGQAYRIEDALNTLLSLSEKAITVVQDPERFRPVDVPEFRGSHQKLTAHTGWMPQCSFEELLHDLLTFWRQHT